MSPTVLVVEDYPDLRFAIADTLSREHYDCDCVGTSDAAIAKLREHRYEVILLAPRLPISSDPVMHFLQEHQPGEMPKVVLMTDPGVVSDCRTLSKPFNPSELLGKLPPSA